MCRHNAVSQPLLTRSQPPLSKALNSGLGSAESDELGFQCRNETMQEAAGVDQMMGVGFDVVPITPNE